MVTVKCLYCDADNDPRATAGYCDSCGKKLPPAAEFRSRRSGEVGTTDTESDLLALSPRRRASESLFTSAVLWLICGGMILVLGPLILTDLHDHFVPAVMATTLAGLGWLALLAVWARRKPRAAALTALMMLFLVWLATVVFLPSTALLTLVFAPVLGFVIRAFLISGRE